MLLRRLLLPLLLLLTTSAQAAKVVVLALPGDDPRAKAIATQLRTAIGEGGDVVVDGAGTRLLLRGPAGPLIDVASEKAVVAAADEAFAAIEHERSVSLLESAIEKLENDRDFSVEKAAVLEDARMKAVTRLQGLAGPAETGKGETKYGERARRHMQNALKANPAVVAGKSFPPKMKALIVLAESDVAKAGLGGLNVTSTPPGAQVWLEGRSMGTTPLVLPNAVAPGRYRLWLEREGRRSIARVVDVDAGAVLSAEIDVGFEGALVGDGLAPQEKWTEEQQKRLPAFFGADVVVVAGAAGDAGAWAWTSDGRAGNVAEGNKLRGLATYLRTGAAAEGVAEGGADAFAAAPAVASTTTTTTDPPAVEGEGEFPWLLVGVGAGVAAIAVTGVIVGLVVVASAPPPTTTVGLSVGSLE